MAMAMYGFDAVSSYLLVVALATLLVAVLVWQPFRNKRTVNVWLASGVVGVLLGTIVPCAMMELKGYELTKAPERPTGVTATPLGPGGGSGMICPKTGRPMNGMGGMSGGPGMAGCPMANGSGGPQSKPNLTALVQKLDLLTGGITLTAKQAAAINDCLRDIEKSANMSDNDAKAKQDQLLAALDEDQKARLAAVGISQPEVGGGMPGMMCGGCPSNQGENPNPFQQDAKGKALKSLRERLVSKGTAPKADTPKAPPAKAETPKAPPLKADASKSAAVS
jgi:hypothetical protein